ncbi:MAG: type II toxin-antitoxin system Phd/YefM family antitoxin [Nitrospirae bacterium]|nr:type II toxin-antitoxin system Phd/YefM family antitoxin [Nitrospirota bacterium]
MESQWQLQTAKNRLSHVVEQAHERGPQTITVHGRPAAVLLSYEEYKRLVARGPRLSRFFAESPLKGAKLDLTRSRETGRDIQL